MSKLKYRQFGKRTIGLKLGLYTISLKLIKTRKKEKQFYITITDNKDNVIEIRGYPSYKPNPYPKNCNEITILNRGNWKIEYITRKGHKPTGKIATLIGEKFYTLTQLFCTMTPQDANELGDTLENFIRKNFYKVTDSNLQYRGSLNSYDTFSTVSQDYFNPDINNYKPFSQTGSLIGNLN